MKPIVAFALMIIPISTTGNLYNIRTNLSVKPRFNESDPCGSSPLLSPGQLAICQNDTRIQQALIPAGRDVQAWCRRAMLNDTWNCATIAAMSPYTVWLEEGTKEAAFISSLRAAFYTIYLWNSCVANQTLCDCPTNGLKFRETGRRYKWQWALCPDALEQSMKISETWTNMDSAPQGRYARLARHNEAIGRRTIEEMAELRFRCRGLNYDDLLCPFGFAHRWWPEPALVVRRLYYMYRRAVHVRPSARGAGGGRLRATDGRQDIRDRLVYSQLKRETNLRHV